MKLSERLNAVKEYLPHSMVIADIGADRGELSLCLLEEGIAKKVILTDISAKSLERARLLFAGKVEANQAVFRVGDGLTVLSPGEVDYAVFAGMGGRTINAILKKSPAVVGSFKGMVIQAMGNSDKVRAYLLQTGFAIQSETLVLEEGQYYTIIHTQPGRQKLSPVEIFAGPCLLAKSDPLLKVYLDAEKKKATTILNELRKRGNGQDRQKELEAYLQIIAEALRLWEENKCG